MTPGPDPYAADGTRRRNTILAAVAGALAVGALIGIGGMRLLDASRKTPGPVLAANAPAPPAVLARTAQAPPPALDVKAESKAMPADVRAWLEHLERIERKRGELSRQGVAKVLVMMPNANMGIDAQGLRDLVNGATDPENAKEPETSADRIEKATGDLGADFDALQREYDTVPPPQACRTLANGYRNALRETGAMISDLVRTIDGAANDPQSAIARLEGMKGDSARIDGYGRSADTELGRICNTYETRKWFSISSDFGGQGMLDKF